MLLFIIFSKYKKETYYAPGYKWNYNFIKSLNKECLCIILGIIFSYGVPIFFMQSGANILNYRDPQNNTKN